MLVSSLGFASSLPELRKAAFLGLDTCQNVIRSDETRLYVGFGSYLPREHTSGSLQVIELAHPENKVMLNTPDAVMDVHAVGDRLFALTYTTIEEWNLTTLQHVGSYRTWLTEAPTRYKDHATGFYFYNNQFFISHGRLGFTVFDISQNKVVDQQRVFEDQLPLESMAMDIAGFGDRAILLFDNFTMTAPGKPGAFRGLAVLDLKSHAIVQKADGLDPGAESVSVIGDAVIVGINPPVWKYSLKKLLNTPTTARELILWKFPGQEGMGIKKFFFDEQYMYACFTQPKPGQFSKFKPVVFNRKDLKLD